MTREEIIHLGKLARIELSETEIDKFTTELSAVLAYVGAVQSLVADEEASGPEMGAQHNIFRPDTVINEPDYYTDAILIEMPAREGRYMKVKKILEIE